MFVGDNLEWFYLEMTSDRIVSCVHGLKLHSFTIPGDRN
jgi:hypothetical protein